MLPSIAASKLTASKTFKDLLILCHTITCTSIGEMIGRIMTESAWDNVKLAELSQIGRRCMNMLLLVFGGSRVQPYAHAVLLEIPVQIALYLKCYKAWGVPCDTTTLNAQCSEHLNKVLKEVEHSISFHRHVTGADSLDVEAHRDSRAFLPFVHEYVTKDLSLRKGLWTRKELIEYAKKKENHVKTDDGTCMVCGGMEEIHKKACSHPWMDSLSTLMTEGKLPDDIKTMLSSAAAQKALTHADVEAAAAPKKNTKTRNVSTEQSKARAKLASRKKKRSKATRRRA